MNNALFSRYIIISQILFFFYASGIHAQCNPVRFTPAETVLTASDFQDQHFINAFAPEISPDGKFLAFKQMFNGHNTLFIKDFSQNKCIKVQTEKGLFIRHEAMNYNLQWRPSDDPDSAVFVFVSNASNPDIVLGETTGRDIYLLWLTSNEAIDDNPRWSPDGNTIAFTSTRGKQIGSDVFIISDLDKIIRIWKTSRGKRYRIRKPESLTGLKIKPVQITHLKEVLYFPAWSPDGSFIAITYVGKDSRYSEKSTREELALIPVSHLKSDIQPIFLTDRDDFQFNAPSWSPDGRFIAFYSYTLKNSEKEIKNKFKYSHIGYLELKRTDQTGISVNRLIPTIGVDSADTIDIETLDGPLWGPDSQSIYYVSFDRIHGNPIRRYCLRDQTNTTLVFETEGHNDLTFSKSGSITYLYFSALPEQIQKQHAGKNIFRAGMMK